MGYTEMWGAIGSKFAEAGVVDGLLPYRSAAKTLSFGKGVVRMVTLTGKYHVRSQEFVLGDLVANTELTVDTTALADGFYRVYAHPIADLTGVPFPASDPTYNESYNTLTDVELVVGGKIVAANMAAALIAADPTAENGSSITTVPEPNYDSSAFKMVAAVPDQDFYKGRSVLLATIKVAAGDITELSLEGVHRVR